MKRGSVKNPASTESDFAEFRDRPTGRLLHDDGCLVARNTLAGAIEDTVHGLTGGGLDERYAVAASPAVVVVQGLLLCC